MFTGRFEKVSFEVVRGASVRGRGMDAPWNILPLPRRAWREWRAILHAAARLPRYAFRISVQFLGDIVKAGLRGDEADLRPGDVIVCIGGSWSTRNFCAHLAKLKRNRKVRFVQLVHDVVPILYPASTACFAPRFGRWLKRVAEVSDLFLTISKSARADLEAVAAAAGFALPPVWIMRYGSVFQTCPEGQTGELDATVPSLPKRFVLCVSTFEPRKNHELLLTVWRNLMEADGPERFHTWFLWGVLASWCLTPGLCAPSCWPPIALINESSCAGV